MYHEHIPVIVVYFSRIGFQEYKCSGPPACVSDLVDSITYELAVIPSTYSHGCWLPQISNHKLWITECK